MDTFNFNIYNSIILAGVIQGFVFAFVVLFNKKYKARSTYFLLAWIVSYSLNNLQYYLLDSGIVSYQEFYDYLYIQWGLLMPPLIILYCHSLVYPDRKLTNGEKWLFSPFLFGFLASQSYKFLRAIGYENATLGAIFQAIVPIGEFMAIFFSIGAIVYVLWVVRRYLKIQKYSNKTVHPQLNWFKTTLYFLLLATIIWAYSEYTYGNADAIFYFYPLWIMVAFLTYWLGHLGIYKYGIHEERKQIRKRSLEKAPMIEVVPQGSEHIARFEAFLKKEQNFLNPDLSLALVAEALQLSSGHLSKIINTDLNMSFKEYVNTLRVEEAQRYLLDSQFAHYTLAAIGLEAGFNSKSAFNASFKKVTGLTPSEYRESHS